MQGAWSVPTTRPHPQCCESIRTPPLHSWWINMVRRSVGFVSKKPHRKSRGGCQTCKRKKVKVGCYYTFTRKSTLTQYSVMRSSLSVPIASREDWIASIPEILLLNPHQPLPQSKTLHPLVRILRLVARSISTTHMSSFPHGLFLLLLRQ